MLPYKFLIALFCIPVLGPCLFGQSKKPIPPEKEKRFIYTVLSNNALLRLNGGVDFRLDERRAVGVEAMASPYFVQFGLRYGEGFVASLWDSPPVGQAYHLRTHYKRFLNPFSSPERNPFFYLAGQLEMRAILYGNARFRSYYSNAGVSNANIRRLAALGNVIVGADHTGRSPIGGYIGFGLGYQHSTFREADGDWADYRSDWDPVRFLYEIKLGVTLGFETGGSLRKN